MSEKPFDTSALDAALERRRKALEQERQQMVDRALRLLDQWGPAFGIRQAYLFGSVARPDRFQRHSDVDLAVEEIDDCSFFRAIARFSGEIGRPVDLVEMQHCTFADKIRREGIRWIQST